MLASVRPFLHLLACQRKEKQLPVNGHFLCVNNQGDYADNLADVVDPLLIYDCTKIPPIFFTSVTAL